MRPFRILPLTITLAVVALAYKAGQTAQGGAELLDHFFISSVQAKEEEKKSEEHAPSETKKEKNDAAEEKKEGPAPPLKPEEYRYSPAEIELLQQLTKRREKLEEWDKNIAVKENLLTTTEKRIDEKLAQMDELKKELSDMLIQYNQQENAKIKSLVSIYENMKPREAARIFDEVEMPILLLVIDRMSEKKAAPILASMDPKKAKILTVQLAEQRRDKNVRVENNAAEAAKPLGATRPAPAPSPAATPAPAAGAVGNK